MVRLKGFQKLTLVDQALRSFMNAVPIGKLRTAGIHLDSALNRVLAESITAEDNLPRIDRSAVDGYAVRAVETVGVSQFKPAIMALVDGSEIGVMQAKIVWTGNSIPKSADAVAMVENTKRVGDKVEIWSPLTPGENVSGKGEDIRKGETAVEAGTRLGPRHLGLIAALGKAKVIVFTEPKIAILATGNELAEIGEKPEKEQVFNVNGHVILALCRELDAEPMDLGIAGDSIEEISNKLRGGLVADAIVTTGGTSVGGADLVPEAVNKIGEPGVIVHGVAMRPGMPTALAVVNKKPIIILPGNPVAAMIGFEVFARPLICRMLGLKQEELRPILKAKSTRRISSALGRRTFVRVRVLQSDGEFLAEPISARGSSIISTMTRSNGYVIVPENREGLEEGESVLVHLFGSVRVVDEHV